MKSEEEKFESIVGGKHQKINSPFHSHRESRFKNPKISGSQRIEVENEEMKVFKKLKYMKSKIEEIERLKKSKIEEVRE
jgi:hypothetical protein